MFEDSGSPWITVRGKQVYLRPALIKMSGPGLEARCYTVKRLWKQL